MLQLRLGNLDGFYGKFGFGDDINLGVFGSQYRFLLGANLASPSSKNDLMFEFGAVRLLGNAHAQVYLGGNYIFADQFMLKPVFQIGHPSYYGMGLGIRAR
jgi:hypothetical protein